MPGPTLQTELNAKTDRLAVELNTVCDRSGVPMQIVNGGSVMFFRVLDGSKAASLLFYLLREKGIYILEGFPSYLSTAHSEVDLRRLRIRSDQRRRNVRCRVFRFVPSEVKAEPSRNGLASTERSAPTHRSAARIVARRSNGIGRVVGLQRIVPSSS